MGCFTSTSSYSVSNGFTNSCLGLEMSCSNPRSNGLINILGRPEDGFGVVNDFLLNGLGLGRRVNQLGGWVVDRGWGIVEAHPWNWLGKFNVLFHPWNRDLFVWLDELFVWRLLRAFQLS